jgi:hypothetical protein
MLFLASMKTRLLISACFAINAAAVEWTPPQPISEMSIGGIVSTVYDPAVGNWVALISAGNSGTPPAYVSISTDHGKSWGPTSPIITDVPTANNDIFGAYDPCHRTLVALWANENAMEHVTGAYSLNGGNMWMPISNPSGSTRVLDGVFVTYNSGNMSLVATWADFNNNQLSYSISTNGGMSWSTAEYFNMMNQASNDVFSAYNPNTGNIIAGWIDTSSSPNNPMTATLTNGGITWNTILTVSDSLPGMIDLFVLYNPVTNTTIATWFDTSFVPYSAVLATDGMSWNTPVPISTTVSSASNILTAYDPVSGITMAAWSDMSSQAWYSLSTDGGASWSSAAQIDQAFVADNQDIFIAYDPVAKYFMATWQDYDSGFPTFSLFDYVPSSTIATNQGGNLGRLAKYLNSNSSLIAPLLNLSPKALDSALTAILPKPDAAVSAANTLFVLGNVMTSRNTPLRRKKTAEPDIALLFERGELLAANEMPYGRAQTAAADKERFAIWFEGVGEFAKQAAQSQLPSFHTKTGAGLVGFDVYDDKFQISSAFSYAKSSVKNSFEHDTINFYALALYGTGYIGNGFIEVGAWGVYNQYDQRRHITFPGFDAEAKSKHHGWQCAPHLRAGYDIPLKQWIFEPFVSADCIFLLQSGFSEKGAAPYNMVQHGSTSEALQTSVGLNTYVWQNENWGTWFVRLTGAYTYKKRFGLGNLTNEAIIGFPPGFSLFAYQSAENLFAPSAEILLRANRYIFGSLNYDGQFGSHYTSNAVYGKLGVFF